MEPRGRLEEVVFETPDPPQRSVPSAAPSKVTTEGLDTSGTSVKDAFDTFAKKEASGGVGVRRQRPKREFQVMGQSMFEPPEQRLARLQAEVSELLKYTEASACKDPAAAELLGADPATMSTELKVLEQRLTGLADGSASWGRSSGRNQANGYSMPASLVSQLERMATADVPAGSAHASGQVTYEIHYTPSVASISDGAKIASMESSIAEIEKQLGVLQPSNPFPDLETAITQLHKRISLLDGQKLETIHKSLDKVLAEVQKVLSKKAELEGTTDKELDQKAPMPTPMMHQFQLQIFMASDFCQWSMTFYQQEGRTAACGLQEFFVQLAVGEGLESQVSQLYDFCHRWSATAASLPLIVARLQSLQALHLQSASFASRLNALEKQQEELAKLLETTSEAVQDLHSGLRENMSIVRDNMKSLEEKLAQAVRS
ncbi:unnamed protein product [Durusdinium trenchii]|uniref:Dynactin subunit 2 n=1 Tax=Durusdinium trenchii TaxID=1381693 RepID=A0ABP0JWR4_9DINO